MKKQSTKKENFFDNNESGQQGEQTLSKRKRIVQKANEISLLPQTKRKEKKKKSQTHIHWYCSHLPWSSRHVIAANNRLRHLKSPNKNVQATPATLFFNSFILCLVLSSLTVLAILFMPFI